MIAGFGGQGVMVMGQLLGQTACDNNMNSAFLAKYGPEQRGGTASCTVAISQSPIGAPVTRYVDILIALNQQSMDKFMGAVRPGGTVMLNSSLCQWSGLRTDVDICQIPANDIAAGLGSEQVANMVMIGAYIEKTGIFTEAQIHDAVRSRFARKAELLVLNERALRAGIDALVSERG
jgi:2-oxoglutarate ferredoxin oxidoreductase subunit gamma